jgi:hypothetical protein
MNTLIEDTADHLSINDFHIFELAIIQQKNYRGGVIKHQPRKLYSKWLAVRDIPDFVEDFCLDMLKLRFKKPRVVKREAR